MNSWILSTEEGDTVCCRIFFNIWKPTGTFLLELNPEQQKKYPEPVKNTDRLRNTASSNNNLTYLPDINAGLLCGEGKALLRMGQPDKLGQISHTTQLVAQVVKYHRHIPLPDTVRYIRITKK